METRKTRLTFGVFFDDQRVMRPAALGKGIAAPPLAREKSKQLSFTPATPEARAGRENGETLRREAMLVRNPYGNIRDGHFVDRKINPRADFTERSRQFKGEISFLKP
jgi:hypothetical protein